MHCRMNVFYHTYAINNLQVFYATQHNNNQNLQTLDASEASNVVWILVQSTFYGSQCVLWHIYSLESISHAMS